MLEYAAEEISELKGQRLSGRSANDNTAAEAFETHAGTPLRITRSQQSATIQRECCTTFL